MNKRILAIYTRPPLLGLPQNSYGQFYILQALQKYYQVKILSFRSSQPTKINDEYFDVNNSVLNKIFNLIFRAKSTRYTHYSTNEFHRAFDHQIINYKPDIIYVDNLLMMQYALKMSLKLEIWFFDDESQLFIYGNRLRKNVKELLRNIGLKRFELKSLSLTKRVFCITHEETIYLQGLGIPKVETVPYPVDDNYFCYNWKPYTGKFKILFVGDFAHYPNKEAVKIISKKIYPHFNNDKYEFLIVGRNIDRIKKYLCPNIKIYEDVDDIRNFYWESSLFLAPIYSGGGLRIKILEAASCGLPIVMSPLANLGINLENSNEVLLAERIEDFIEIIDHVSSVERLKVLTQISLMANKKIKSSFSLIKMLSYYENVFNPNT